MCVILFIMFLTYYNCVSRDQAETRQGPISIIWSTFSSQSWDPIWLRPGQALCVLPHPQPFGESKCSNTVKQNIQFSCPELSQSTCWNNFGKEEGPGWLVAIHKAYPGAWMSSPVPEAGGKPEVSEPSRFCSHREAVLGEIASEVWQREVWIKPSSKNEGADGLYGCCWEHSTDLLTWEPSHAKHVPLCIWPKKSPGYQQWVGHTAGKPGDSYWTLVIGRSPSI